MERFAFNLQRVLDFRVTIEDQKKDEFVRAQKLVLREEDTLNYLIKQREAASESIGGFKQSNEYQAFARYMEFMNNKIEQQREVLNTAKQNLEIKKEELIKSTFDRKILEKLKEKAKAEFDFEMSKKEQKQNDDFGLFSYIRNGRR